MCFSLSTEGTEPNSATTLANSSMNSLFTQTSVVSLRSMLELSRAKAFSDTVS